jgi:homospermidine synthase
MHSFPCLSCSTHPHPHLCPTPLSHHPLPSLIAVLPHSTPHCTRAEWAAISQALGVKVIHIAEVDTQVKSWSEAAGAGVSQEIDAGTAHAALCHTACRNHDTYSHVRVTGRMTGRRPPGLFVNTWSVDGFVEESLQPAEMGWGSHERTFPEDGARHSGGEADE